MTDRDDERAARRKDWWLFPAFVIGAIVVPLVAYGLYFLYVAVR